MVTVRSLNMEGSAQLVRAVRFGSFELDMRSGELRKNGLKVKLQDQPFQVLSLLLEHPGEVITRDEMRAKLWPRDTFVDFEHSLATDINKLREALGDTVQSPRFIETLPRRGYRFIAPVESFVPASSIAATVTPVNDRQTEDAAHRAALQRPEEKAQPAKPMDDPPVVVAIQEAIPQAAPQVVTDGYTRRAVAAVMQGAMEEHRARVRWRRWAVAGLSFAGLSAVLALIAWLNVAGLRDRAFRAAGAVREPPLQIQSIAVLPLENVSRDPEQEYFADGMTDALITDLGKISALRVISRTSVMTYKGKRKALPEIARDLNVDAVVDGTVLRSGDRVRITANLMHAPTDRHLWAETYESDQRDVLVLQSELARAIVEQVRVVVTPQETIRLASPHAVVPEAYEAYLRGRYLERKETGDGYQKAISYYELAIEKDPNYALAYGRVARCYFVLPFFAPVYPQEVVPKAKAAARKALELDDTLVDGHVALAWGKAVYDWDWSGAESEYKRALELNPGSASPHGTYGWFLAWMGRFDEALRETRRARELDPLSLGATRTVGIILYCARQYDQAISEMQKALEWILISFS